MIDCLNRIYSQLGDIINGISNEEYSISPLIAYINDNLQALSEYIEYVKGLHHER